MAMTSATSSTAMADSVQGISPIILHLPGHTHDTRLTVFSQDFHVHSVVLKMNSEFFRAFMDSPDKTANRQTSSSNRSTGNATKTAASPASDIPDLANLPMNPSILYNPVSSFKYNWASELDDLDDYKNSLTRYLICADTKTHPCEIQGIDHPVEELFYIEVFEKFLLAIYGQPYTLNQTTELHVMTKYADYYRDLLALSRSLDGALLRSRDWVEYVAREAADILQLAVKLRHPRLFREALVWVVGPHSCPRYLGIADARLRMIAECAHAKILREVSACTQAIFRELARDGQFLEVIQQMTCTIERTYDESFLDDHPHTQDTIRPDKRVFYPFLFRKMSEDMEPLADIDQLDRILRSNLILEREKRAGDPDFGTMDHFLCAEISDEDLPWDTKQLDW